MRGVDDPFVEHSLGIGEATSAERSVGLQVAVSGGDLYQPTSVRRPVLDPLAKGSWGLTRSWTRRILASHDFQHLACTDLRKHFGVEKRA